MKVAIIGAGNMGGAIAKGLAQGSIITANDIIVSNPSQGKLDALQAAYPAIKTTNDNVKAALQADMVILAVKPWLAEEVLKEMQDYVAQLSKEAELPVVIKTVIIGKAIPNAEQLAEMNRTAKAVQAKQTQEREAEVQIAREKAERQRAIADKAYQQEMGLSAQQFIQLKAWDIIAQKQAANIDVLFNADGTNKMWNIK